MPINNIEIFSNSFNQKKFNPDVILDGYVISILPDTFFSDGKEFFLQESVDITIPTVTENSYLKVFFVEELSTGDFTVVVDIIVESDPSSEWVPDRSQHKILHSFIDIALKPNIQDINDLDIFVYRICLPKQSQLNGGFNG